MDELKQAASLERIEGKIDVMNVKIDNLIVKGEDHEERIRCLEQKGGRRWESVVGYIMSSGVGTAVGFLASKLAAKP